MSIRTVSRALKNQPGVKPEVGRNVLELARHLGYTPNVAARNLRMNRSNIVGIIVSQNYKNSVSGRKVNDLQKRLEEQGFYPLFGLLPSDFRGIASNASGMVGADQYCGFSELASSV
ncbi:MAG: LacI family transcriptional regulator [Lentisphaerae bacterium]|nr:LacI family transcriptional regulator [Lentisphaerota bacterium]